LLLFQNDEPPEITYCVVDQTGTLSLQALTPTLPMPAEEELNAKFAELVVSAAVLGRASHSSSINCMIVHCGKSETNSMEQSLS
jgi:hypothetical protein